MIVNNSILSKKSIIAFLVLLLTIYSGYSSTIGPVISNPIKNIFPRTLAEDQEAGDFNWRQWYVLLPIADDEGNSKKLKYRQMKRYDFDPSELKFIKRNSNATLSFTTRFTGVTEYGPADLNERKYSSSEMVEIYESKYGDDFWTNKGNHEVKTRFKVHKLTGAMKNTYMARITSKNERNVDFDLVRIMWRNGTLLAEVYDEKLQFSRPYRRVKIAQVDEEMFNFTLRMSNGKVYVSLKCNPKDVRKENFPIASFSPNAGYKNLFRLGNLYRNDKNFDDSVTVQIKYAILKHSKSYR